jgi:hypothetical protein
MIKQIGFRDVTDELIVVNGVSFVQVDERIYALTVDTKEPARYESPMDDEDAVIDVRELPKEKKYRVEPTPESLALGEKIKAARIDSGVPIVAFAKAGGFSATTHLHALESGRFRWMTKKVAQALKVWGVELPDDSSPLWRYRPKVKEEETTKAGTPRQRRSVGKKITIKGLAQRIRWALKEHTDKSAAEMCGVSDSCISNWKNGRFEFIGPSLKAALGTMGVPLPPDESPLWTRPSLR